MSNITFAETFKAVYETWITRYCRPYKIIADLGTNFDETSFKQFIMSNYIKVHVTCTGYKEGNGVVDRLNLTLLDFVRVNIEEELEWAKLLPRVMQILRFS